MFLKVIYKISIYIKRWKVKKKWRIRNSHNFTFVVNTQNDPLFPIDKVSVGKFSYGNLLVWTYGSDDECLQIGSYCSIAENVKFILGGMHNINTLSSYPFKVKILKENVETFSKGAISIGDDVWVGANSLILSGCKIGEGSIIASGSVVVKSVEPYSIVGGNPAKLIRKRYDEEIISYLLKLDKVKLLDAIVESGNIDLFYQELTIPYLKKLEMDFLYDERK